jgi:hypothetical protein
MNDKQEETDKLKEFIEMEEEKLKEAEKAFNEDCEKFHKYVEEIERRAIDM